MMIRTLFGFLLMCCTCRAGVLRTREEEGSQSLKAKLAEDRLLYEPPVSMSYPIHPTKGPKSKAPHKKKGPKSKKSKEHGKTKSPGKGKGGGKGGGKGKGSPSKSKSKKGPKGKGKGNSPAPHGPIPTQPTRQPRPTPPSPDIQALASPYRLRYIVSNSEFPQDPADYVGVTEMTAAFLDDFFTGAVSGQPSIDFLYSTTVYYDREFVILQYIDVYYNTSLFFAQGSVIPTQGEINAGVQAAFTTEPFASVYLSALANLQNNIFSTTSSYTFAFEASNPTEALEGGDGGDPAGSGEPAGESDPPITTAGIAAAAGAGAFVVLISAVMIHRRRRNASFDDEASVVKYLDHEDGHMTVAGETAAGTLSVDSRTVRSDAQNWEGSFVAPYHTSTYRSNSPTMSSEGQDSDESSRDSSEGSAPRRQMETVEL